MTDYVFILLELVSNLWSVDFSRVDVGIDELISFDRKCVVIWSGWVLVGGIRLVVLCLWEVDRGLE